MSGSVTAGGVTILNPSDGLRGRLKLGSEKPSKLEDRRHEILVDRLWVAFTRLPCQRARAASGAPRGPVLWQF
jgi:hypothetical protein